MAHIASHGEPHSLQSAMQLDMNQRPVPHPLQTSQPGTQTVPRKRKKNDSGDDVASVSEPRRLRRSHEACARCRSKKIKCDSKHPKCSACATAGAACNQEDRHRQTLTPRGHTDRIEQQLAQCEALLKRHYQNFDLNQLDDLLAREGVDLHLPTAFQYSSPPSSRLPPTPPSATSPKGYIYPSQPMMQTGYVPVPYSPSGQPYPLHVQIQPSGPYNPHILPGFQHSQPGINPLLSQHRLPPSHDIKGQDPQLNDMSSSQALAKNFGVSAEIVNEVPLGPPPAGEEDLGVGSSELASGRDRGTSEYEPRDKSQWFRVSLRRSSISNPYMSPPEIKPAPSPAIWLPQDSKMVKHIVDIYFTRLNIHRPVFPRRAFESTLNALYESQTLQVDAGYICSLYLILALGTLSELNRGATKQESATHNSSTPHSKLVLRDWPLPGEFFDRALSVKPDLRVAISSLQALILLHWYLYTERQGRTLWRLVGSLVRLSIELGLHHDPTAQGNTFTEEESRLRINLWAIVMVHDRGTSILLGRPLAIAASDSNTPQPVKGKQDPEFSEHFLLSSPMAEIQADIINSLYMPTRQNGDSIMRQATRIIKSMEAFRKSLPDSYKLFFGGTEDWRMEDKIKLVQEITEDQGLTLLKFGIARILLLRVLFNSKDLSLTHRHKALVDAIVTSHNIIIIHKQLIRFPDIAFFVSPIPLHISAMVILYGHMSQCDRLTRETALEDIWMALDLLPRLRWRWERKDLNGGHPLIAKVAEHVLQANLNTIRPPSNPILLTEQDWDDSSVLVSPTASNAMPSQQTTPTSVSMPYSAGGTPSYGPHQQGSSAKGVAGVPMAEKQLVEVPTGLFYPFYPEDQSSIPPGPFEGLPNAANSVANGAFGHILAAATAQQPDSGYACQPSQEALMLEDRDPNIRPTGSMQMWIGLNQQGNLPFPIPQA